MNVIYFIKMLPLTTMALQFNSIFFSIQFNSIQFNSIQFNSILERLLCTVILPCRMYGLALYESHMKDGDYEYLDAVQGRLIKALFGV